MSNRSYLMGICRDSLQLIAPPVPHWEFTLCLLMDNLLILFISLGQFRTYFVKGSLDPKTDNYIIKSAA